MCKDIKFFGIDVSKSVFDVYNDMSGHHQYENNAKGIREFASVLDGDCHVVMESTGFYHYQLGTFLLDKGFKTSVENPLKIRRFIQMSLTKVKTDKADAEKIFEYARQAQDLSLWERPNIEAMQLLSLLDTYQRQSTQIKNKLEDEATIGISCKQVVRSLKSSLKHLQKEMANIELALEEMVKAEDSGMLANLQTIPGIGRKTAVFLIIATNYFSDFETAAQLCSFAGLTPIIRRSGSSVRGRERISKMGNPKLRNLLFMCSFNACKYNEGCRNQYERITSKGKSKKLALIAVCNKLLKQSFAIAKSGLCYDPNFKSKLA